MVDLGLADLSARNSDAKNYVKRGLDEVKERIYLAAERSGRRVEDVRIMGVTKFQPLEAIYAARDAGLSLFGENRVQERDIKRASWEGPDAEWHMVGHLQRNKARRALELFDCIQSVDSVELASTLERIIEESDDGGEHFESPYPIMVEVNTSGEISKQGIMPEKSFALIDDIAVKCPSIVITGLMTIGPLTRDEGRIQGAFASLRQLKDSAREKFGLELPHLSMGMSGDFELAIIEGSTIVRVGTAIFGSRKP